MNQKGGFAKSLRCLQNHSPVVSCMLKNRFLEHTENYTLRFEDFVLCEDTNIFEPVDDLVPLIEINRLGPARFRNGIGDPDLKFRGNFKSVSGFVKALDHFLFRAGVVIMSYGLDQAFSFDHPAIGQVGANGRVDVFDGSAEAFPKQGHIASCFIAEDGRLGLKLSKEFSDNCYLRFHPLLQKAFGFPPIIYTYDSIIGGIRSNHANWNQAYLLDDAGFHLTLASQIGNDQRPLEDQGDTIIYSRRHVDSIDRRVSLDMTATLPIARRVNIVQEKESHDHLLARFNFRELNKFTVHMFPDMQTHEITETTVIGQDELTRGSFQTEALQLLPGNIQQITLQLFIRYLDEENNITSKLLPLDQGFWSCCLQFIKKT